MYICNMQLTVRNAHANNLKGIDLTIPHHQLVVITGVSGSGKSSLAFDVIANAGKTEFLQNIPAYARKYGGKKKEVKADAVEGLFPVVTVSQHAGNPSSKSTLGTLSDTYDLLRLLFARFGVSNLNETKLTRSLFSFNTKEGACSHCQGIGLEEYISIEKLIADEAKSLRDGALIPTQPNGYTMYSQVTVDALNEVCEAHGFTVDIPWNELTQPQIEVVLYGSERVKIPFGKHSETSRLKWTGIKAKPREKGFYRGMIPIMSEILLRDRNKNILRFVDAATCSVCLGTRLSAEALQVKWQGESIDFYAGLSLIKLQQALLKIDLSKKERLVINELLNLVEELSGLGLGHHSLATEAVLLTQGEIQRVRLINQLRSGLSNVLYVFDEPGIGLHPKFQHVLINKFQQLVAEGNSVILVEHALSFIHSADWIIEIGPKAGSNGGEVLFNGSFASFLKSELTNSATLDLLLNRNIPAQAKQAESAALLEPGSLAVVTGLNGSGKHSFVNHKLEAYKGEVNHISRGPIGKTPRSNPATYTGLSEVLRNVFAASSEAKASAWKRTHFSVNTSGGRCETCLGAGVVSLGMSYLGNVEFACETCSGKRFKDEVLKVKLNGKSIADIYALTADDALVFFGAQSAMAKHLQMLKSVGLGYLVLGQSSSTLSGGEAQRLKLAARLMDKKSGVIVLDEPTNGLHASDLTYLKVTLHKLLEKGYSIVCIDFNATLMSWANKVIELDLSGEILFDGLYSDLLLSEKSQFAQHILAQPKSNSFEKTSTQAIEIKGVRTHNLKSIDVSFPVGKLTSVIGRSGSGKTSLVMDTLHAIANERFVNGLSAYQRHYVPTGNASDFDSAKGIRPSIAITRENTVNSSWEVVAKSLGVYEKLRFLFSRSAELEGKMIPASSFNFTSTAGACPECGGKGEVLAADRYKLASDWNLSASDGAFSHSKTLAYYGAPDSRFFALLKALAKARNVDLEKPLNDLSANELELLFEGAEEQFKVQWSFTTKTRSGTEEIAGNWKGISTYINEEYLARKENKNISGITALMSESTCNSCLGKRLNKSSLSVLIESKSIADVLAFRLHKFAEWIAKKRDQSDLEKVFQQFRKGLLEAVEVGNDLNLNYLSLDRKVSTLSGGEYQRIRLAHQLGQPLIGLTLVLDEPCAGLDETHANKVITLLKRLRDRGNTVISISHNEALIQASDYIIELGPGAGEQGGMVLQQFSQIEERSKGVHYPKSIAPQMPDLPLKMGELVFHHPKKYTLELELVKVLRGALNQISGNSGAGKSTLLEKVILPSLSANAPINCVRFEANFEVEHIFAVQQRNMKAPPLETVFSFSGMLEWGQKEFLIEAKAARLPLKKAHFDYRSKEGRCPACEGKGRTMVALDIVSEQHSTCEVCLGSRYTNQMDLKVKGKRLAEIMHMSLTEISSWLSNVNGLAGFLDAIAQIGLSHLKLGQSIDSLSFGEFQRLRLVQIMQQTNLEKTFIALDEPTQGLHPLDIELVLKAISRLVQKGATVVVIDHNPCFENVAQHVIHLPDPERNSYFASASM
jgi:excinuclease ABC subunit A